jgi:hypothetical protein
MFGSPAPGFVATFVAFVCPPAPNPPPSKIAAPNAKPRLQANRRNAKSAEIRNEAFLSALQYPNLLASREDIFTFI